MKRADLRGERYWLMRGVGVFGVAALVLWAIPEEPDGRWAVLSLLAVFVAGTAAGYRVAWLVGPASVAAVLLLKAASDCPDCGGGGEEIATPWAVWLVVLLISAVVAMAGAAVGAFVQLPISRSVPGPGPWSLVVAGSLGVAAVLGLAVVRWESERDRLGPVVSEAHGIRNRAGDPLDGPEVPVGLRDFGGSPAVWFGRTVAGFELTQATLQKSGPPSGQWKGDTLTLIYGTCGPAPCPAPVSLSITTWCRVPPEFAGETSTHEALPGGALLQRHTNESDRWTVWSGNVSVTVYLTGVPSGERESLLPQLRTVDGADLPAPAPATC